MSSEARIDALETRMDRFEDTVGQDIRRIFEKLDALTEASHRNHCPTPGACITLSAELQHVLKAHNSTMLRVERLELELIRLNQQKAWIVGAWTVIAFFASIVGAAITFVVGKLWTP